jgi:hypothetical protein
MAETAKNVLGSFREAIQDLLVPELKALRVSVDSLRTEMHLRTDSLQREMQLRDETLRAELKLRDENLKAEMQAVRTEMHAGDKTTQDALQALGQKLDFAIDIRERLVVLEARLPKQ